MSSTEGSRAKNKRLHALGYAVPVVEHKPRRSDLAPARRRPACPGCRNLRRHTKPGPVVNTEQVVSLRRWAAEVGGIHGGPAPPLPTEPPVPHQEPRAPCRRRHATGPRDRPASRQWRCARERGGRRGEYRGRRGRRRVRRRRRGAGARGGGGGGGGGVSRGGRGGGARGGGVSRDVDELVLVD